MSLSLSKPSEKWFFLIVLPIAIAFEWAFAATLDWSAYPRSEWVALIDLCVFMPLVYFFAFSSDLEFKARMLRALGVAGLGLFASSFLVPKANQFVIGELSNLRNAMLIFVLAFEVWVFSKIVSAVYRKNADAETLRQDFALPGWVAKLMLLEARFWKAIWSLFKNK